MLRTLELRDNAMGDEGARAFAELMPRNVALSTLDLVSTGITAVGIAALRAGLATSTANPYLVLFAEGFPHLQVRPGGARRTARTHIAHAQRTHSARTAHAWCTDGARIVHAHGWCTHGARMAHAAARRLTACRASPPAPRSTRAGKRRGNGTRHSHGIRNPQAREADSKMLLPSPHPRKAQSAKRGSMRTAVDALVVWRSERAAACRPRALTSVCQTTSLSVSSTRGSSGRRHTLEPNTSMLAPTHRTSRNGQLPRPR